MKLPVALAAALCLFADPAWSQYVTREQGPGLSASARSGTARTTRTNEESIWIIGCRLIINTTDLFETADKMQQDLDEALSGEPCRRAVAEISLADKLRRIRERIKELREEEEG